jgi:hypothetical protein
MAAEAHIIKATIAKMVNSFFMGNFPPFEFGTG